MAKNSIFFINSSRKTKNWWIFLSVFLLVFVPYLIVLLLAGDINLLEKNWIVAQNASVWHGTLRPEIIDDLVNRYSIFWNPALGDMRTVLVANIDKSISIDSYKLFFNPVVLAPLLGLLAWSLIYPMIFNATKVSGLDVLPFSLAIAGLMLTLILSGLIPQWGQQGIAWYWLVRMIISFIAAITFFMISNFFVNQFLATRDYSFDMYFGYKVQEKQNLVAREELKDNIKTFKDNQDKDYVDVPVEVK